VRPTFVAAPTFVGPFVRRDAIGIHRSGGAREQRVGDLARAVQSMGIPGKMDALHVPKTRMSLLVIVPLGSATGRLASTIALGGFAGVPGMMYVPGAPGFVASAGHPGSSPPAPAGARCSPGVRVAVRSAAVGVTARHDAAALRRTPGDSPVGPPSGAQGTRNEPATWRSRPRGGLTGINGVRHPAG
jgi:hypothetical protein